MNYEELKLIIPEVVQTKDNFGGQYYYIPADILSKRKAWNKYLKAGFKKCPNQRYLRNGNIHLYDNKLKPYLIVLISEQ